MLMEFRSYWREPGVIFWSILFPVGIAGVLGLGFLNRSAPVYRVAVAGEKLPAAVRAASLAALADSTGPQLLFTHYPAAEAALKLKRGEVTLVVAQDSATGQPVFRLDPANPEAQAAFGALENLMLKQQVGNYPRPRTEAVTTQGYRYIDFLIPGLVAFGLMNSAVWGIGWSLVEYRVKKLLRRMVASPLRKSHFMLAQILVRLTITLVEIGLLLAFARLAFGVWPQGSWGALVLVTVSGLWAFAGIGMLIASRTQKTAVANGLVNAVTLPMSILSGVFYSYQGFPDWAVAVIKWLPLTLLADNLRAIFNEGAGLAQVATGAAVLAGLGTALFALGLRVFKWY
jgi:ABC-type multidrug transport system permease subunit